MNFIKFYKENKNILIGLFILSLLAFGFFGTNLILNIDGINDFPMNEMANGYQTHLAMGRWGWALISLMFGYMPVPFFLLFLNCFLLSVSAVYLNRIFNIKNKIYQFIIGAILICFPYAANVFSYLQWQFIYGLGIFIIIYGLYLIHNSKKIIDLIIPTLLFTLVISFYQAFLPVIITFIVSLIIMAFNEKAPLKTILFNIGKYILTLIIASILYVLITKLLINIFHIEMLDYQNAKEMFSFSLSKLPENIYIVLINMAAFFKNQLTFPSYLKVFFYCLLLFNLISSVFIINKKHIPLYLLLIIVLLFAPRTLEIIDPNRWFHDITLLGYLALFTSGIALLFKNIEMYSDLKILKKIALIIFIPIIYILIITINKAAVLAKMTEEAGLSFINRLQTKVESLEGYGDLPELKKYFIINNLNVEYFPYNKDLYPYSIGVTTSFILNEKDMVDALRVLGINATTASDKMDKPTRKEIFGLLDNRDKDIDSMKCYPDQESMFIYKEIIVISMCQFN